jgi:hypothetical protein
VIRAFAALLGIVAALAGSVGAFAAIRAVGPKDRTGEFGFGKAATVAPGGGTLFQTRNFARVVTALKRELGPGASIANLDVKATDATGYGRAGGRVRIVQIDASGRSRTYDGGAATPAALIPIARIDPVAIDRLVRGAHRENPASLESLGLEGGTRQWSIELSDGDPDRLAADLDGHGVRLPGEPDPEPAGATPDSLLRAANLTRVFAAARKDISDSTRVTSLDIRPDRVTLEVKQGSRTLSLTYGYDAQLTEHRVSARTGADEGSVAFESLDPQAVERMARSAQRLAHSKGLGDVQYVLLDLRGIVKQQPELALYLPSGHTPAYVVANLHGRGLTWPGRK